MKDQFYKNIFANAKNLLLIIIIFHGINNIFWFKNDGHVYPGTHAVWLEEKSFLYSRILVDDKASIPKKVLDTLNYFKLSRSGYAFSATNFNLTSFLIALPISTSFNGPVKLFLIDSILFLQFLIVLLAIYYLGKIVFNETVGAWSGIIFSFYPGIMGLSRKVNSELMVTFFIILTVIAFFRRKHAVRITGPLLLFVIFALGAFSGGLFFVFFIPLFLLQLCYDLFFYKRKRETLLNLSVFLCLVFLFFNFYFDGEWLKIFSNLKEGLNECCQKLLARSNDFIGSAANGISQIFFFAPQDSSCPCTQTTNVGINIKTFFFYIMEIIYYASPLFFLLAIFSLLFLFRDKKINFHIRMFFGIWVFFGYLLLTLFHIKWGKFITPVLPVLALSSGALICNYFKILKIKKAFIFFIGILTIFYYSYFSPTLVHFLEHIDEGIVSHAPAKSRIMYVTRQVAAKINDCDISGGKGDTINIGFLDKESVRFNDAWLIDLSMETNNLISVFLKKNFSMNTFWSLSDDFYHGLSKQDFIILITRQKMNEIESYLYPTGTEDISGLKFDIVYKDHLRKNVLVYLLKISRT